MLLKDRHHLVSTMTSSWKFHNDQLVSFRSKNSFKYEKTSSGMFDLILLYIFFLFKITSCSFKRRNEGRVDRGWYPVVEWQVSIQILTLLRIRRSTTC